MIQKAHTILKLADAYRRAVKRGHGVTSARQALLTAAQKFKIRGT